jgi:hypothetical protein
MVCLVFLAALFSRASRFPALRTRKERGKSVFYGNFYGVGHHAHHSNHAPSKIPVAARKLCAHADNRTAAGWYQARLQTPAPFAGGTPRTRSAPSSKRLAAPVNAPQPNVFYAKCSIAWRCARQRTPSPTARTTRQHECLLNKAGEQCRRPPLNSGAERPAIPKAGRALTSRRLPSNSANSASSRANLVPAPSQLSRKWPDW